MDVNNLKFRAWNETQKIMEKVMSIEFLINEDNEEFIGITTNKSRCCDKLILMQYTGLKDKNGVEIYDGDIVYNAFNKVFGKIVFEPPSFRLYYDTFVENLDRNKKTDCINVVGNIYENSDLLQI
jgi:hypothetical protein